MLIDWQTFYIKKNIFTFVSGGGWSGGDFGSIGDFGGVYDGGAYDSGSYENNNFGSLGWDDK